MKPGHELDAIIAEKVMGWKKIILDPPRRGLTWMWDRKEGTLYSECKSTPNYSTDMGDAWEVVEFLCEKKDLGFQLDYEDGSVTFLEHQDQDDGPAWIEDVEYRAWGDSIPHSICLAALEVPENKK